MLRLALAFLVVALVAALFGFNLITGYAYDAARIFFFVFLALAVVTFLADAFRVRSPDPI